VSDKQCHPCTACCEGWLKANINGEKMKPGKPCVHLVKEGCGIYQTRPENPCVAFKCAWLQEQSNFPEHMKPSECGAIVMIRKLFGRQVIHAAPTGKEIPADTLEWLMVYAREQSLPLTIVERIVEDGKYVGIKRVGYGPPSFIKAVQTQLGPEDIMTF